MTSRMTGRGRAALPFRIAKAQAIIAPQSCAMSSTSSTALQALTDAVLYLTNYPYLCSEQSASRIALFSSMTVVQLIIIYLFQHFG